MITLSRPRRIGGDFGFSFGSNRTTDWGQIGMGGINAIGQWAVAREQRRAVQAGADAAAIAAMQPGARAGAFFGGNLGGIAAVGLGALALVLLVK